MGGLNRGSSYKFNNISEYGKNGVHEIKGKFWIMRHRINGHYRTLEGKFDTEKEANEAYEKWVSDNCE